jgi:hypothetical protein
MIYWTWPRIHVVIGVDLVRPLLLDEYAAKGVINDENAMSFLNYQGLVC